MSSSPTLLETEFDACLSRHGITISAERREAMYQAFLAFRDLISANREGLTPDQEPAFIHPAPGETA
ncbi:hypothetical protein [Salinicola salarius]|uniref:hypothetical protein n=1 Tax=Salinicola salarius TaxID=430457 RepID=UPI00117A4DFF|nr:hypothetical protein [Salinicola salarius]